MPTISSTELFKRSRELKRLMNPCKLCPRRCLAYRQECQVGYCHLGDTILLSSILPHHGEEPPISGVHGSGTIFLSGCNAGCIFCQNYQISHERIGREISPSELALEFVKLQDYGCHNINWVTPTPQLPNLVEALAIAVEQGLNIPLVYNTNGYDRLEILQLLDGIVDIYLPDMKYSSDHWAEEFSDLPDYTAVNITAVKEMYRQTGALQLDSRQIAFKGLLVRHLVLPEGTAGSRKVFQSIAAIDPQIPVSIMAQYHPCYHAIGHPILGRRITLKEYQQVLDVFEETGLENAYVQDITDLKRQDSFFPDFQKTNDSIFGK